MASPKSLSILSEGILARIVHYCGTLSLHELIRCGNRLLTHKLCCLQGVPYYCNQNEFGTSIHWSIFVLEQLRGLKKVKLVSKSEEPHSLAWLFEKLPPTIEELNLVAADPLKQWGGDNGRFDWKARFPDLSRLTIKVNRQLKAEELTRKLIQGSHPLAGNPEHKRTGLAIAKFYKGSDIWSQVLVELDTLFDSEERHSVPFSLWLDNNLSSLPRLTSFRCDQLLVNANQYLSQLPMTLESITLRVTEVIGVSWLSCFPLLHSLKVTCKESWILSEEALDAEKQTSVASFVTDLRLLIPHFKTGNRPSTNSEVLEFYSNFSLTEKLAVFTTLAPAQIHVLFPKLKSMRLYNSDLTLPPTPMYLFTQLKELRVHRDIDELDLPQFVAGLPQHLVVLSLGRSRLTPALVGCLPRTILDLEFSELIGSWHETLPCLPPNLTKLSIPTLDSEEVLADLEPLLNTSIIAFTADAPFCRVPNSRVFGRITEAFLRANWDLLSTCLHYSTLGYINQQFEAFGSLQKDGISKDTFLQLVQLVEQACLTRPSAHSEKWKEDVARIDSDVLRLSSKNNAPILDWLQRRWQFFVPTKNDQPALSLATTLINTNDAKLMLRVLPHLSPSEWYHVVGQSDVVLGHDEFIPVLQWLFDHNYPYDAYKNHPHEHEASVINSAFLFHQMNAAIWAIDHSTNLKPIFAVEYAIRGILEPVADYDINVSLPALISLAAYDTRDFLTLLTNLRRNHCGQFQWQIQGTELDPSASRHLMFCFLDFCPVFSPFALPLLDILIDDFGMDPFDYIPAGRSTRLRRKSLRDFFIPVALVFCSPNEWQMLAVEWMIKRGLSLEPRNLKTKEGQKFKLSLAHFAANQSNLPLLLLLHQHGVDLDLPGGPESLTPRQLLPSRLRASLPSYNCSIN